MPISRVAQWPIRLNVPSPCTHLYRTSISRGDVSNTSVKSGSPRMSPRHRSMQELQHRILKITDRFAPIPLANNISSARKRTFHVAKGGFHVDRHCEAARICRDTFDYTEDGPPILTLVRTHVWVGTTKRGPCYVFLTSMTEIHNVQMTSLCLAVHEHAEADWES